MDQGDSRGRSPGTAAEHDEPAEAVEGYLSRVEPYVRRGTRSGAIAAVVGAATLLRAGGSLLRRNWQRGVARLLVGAGWILVAVVQRRTARGEPDRPGVDRESVPGTSPDEGRRGAVEPPGREVGSSTGADETPIDIQGPDEIDEPGVGIGEDEPEGGLGEIDEDEPTGGLEEGESVGEMDEDEDESIGGLDDESTMDDAEDEPIDEIGTDEDEEDT